MRLAAIMSKTSMEAPLFLSGGLILVFCRVSCHRPDGYLCKYGAKVSTFPLVSMSSFLFNRCWSYALGAKPMFLIPEPLRRPLTGLALVMIESGSLRSSAISPPRQTELDRCNRSPVRNQAWMTGFTQNRPGTSAGHHFSGLEIFETRKRLPGFYYSSDHTVITAEGLLY